MAYKLLADKDPAIIVYYEDVMLNCCGQIPSTTNIFRVHKALKRLLLKLTNESPFVVQDGKMHRKIPVFPHRSQSATATFFNLDRDLVYQN